LPDEQTQERFLAKIADKDNLPVLVHDSDGKKRVSILASVWLRKAAGCSTEEAVKIVEEIKERPVTSEEREFIENLGGQD